jgi:RimJ/RimL family protein N-acetyltransferase
MIHLLQPHEWQEWKAIRLEAVKNCPEAFGGAWEDEIHQQDSIYETTLKQNSIFAARDGNKLIGVVGLSIPSLRKLKHRGKLFSMYVQPHYRGKKISTRLLEQLCSHAQNKVQQIQCSVVSTNHIALKLYQKHGFTTYGHDPRALHISGTYYDEQLMIKHLDS